MSYDSLKNGSISEISGLFGVTKATVNTHRPPTSNTQPRQGHRTHRALLARTHRKFTP
ncbi:MAG: hypothetical protein PHD48_08230 [Alphaproteobacteria bacterium]|nr:hypothetical protein [Alphaproteobacteria bacterium]